jgi:hypothetical protein
VGKALRTVSAWWWIAALAGLAGLASIGPVSAAGTPTRLAAGTVTLFADDPSATAFGDVSGPGQAVSMPAPQCPRTIACQYAERNFLPDGYRLQSLQVCGANCTTQYWVSAIDDGRQLIATDPIRGGGVVAVARAPDPGLLPSVRIVLPSYADGDPACCPSGFADTTYTWDRGSNALVPGEPSVTPASDFPGWDAVRQELTATGWQLGGV